MFTQSAPVILPRRSVFVTLRGRYYVARNLQPACLEQVIVSFELSRLVALVCGLQPSRKTESATLIDGCKFSYDIIVEAIESNGKSADA